MDAGVAAVLEEPQAARNKPARSKMVEKLIVFFIFDPFWYLTLLLNPFPIPWEKGTGVVR